MAALSIPANPSPSPLRRRGERRFCQQFADFLSELLGCSCDFKTQIRVVLSKLTRGFQHYRKNLSHLAGTTAGEESDQIWIALVSIFRARNLSIIG